MKEIRKFYTKKQVLKEYEKTAHMYDVNRSMHFIGKKVDQLQTNLIYKLIKENKCRKILEAGCGTGRILLPLAKKGLKCFGIDPSKNMLDQLKRKKPKKVKIQLKIGDIENIPFKSNTFDCCYTVHVLMHLPDYKKAFKEMYRVTKKGGIIICDFPNKDSPWTKLAVFLNPKMKRTRLFTIKELKEFFAKDDYQITGLFSYARTFYKISFLKHVIFFFERFLPLPIWIRTQLFVIVKKR